MKHYLIPIIILSFCYSCVNDTGIKSEVSSILNFVPDNTPFIMGLIEASNDTLHYFPEFVVGFVSQKQRDDNDDVFKDYRDYNDIKNTDLLVQVVNTSKWFNLSFFPELDAVVRLEGPLSEISPKKVTLTNLGNGRYGDDTESLKLLPGESYKMETIFPDGRKYYSETIIPSQIDIDILNSFDIEVSLRKYETGEFYEKQKSRNIIEYGFAPETKLLLIQNNTNQDREYLFLEPNEKFLFEERGDFVRSGSLYGVGLAKKGIDTLYQSWIQNLAIDRTQVIDSAKHWYRFSFFSSGIGDRFIPMEEFYSAKEEWLNSMNSNLYKAFDTNDSTYLFRTSTIQKISENGDILPIEETDAIGFFGGYFSVYRKSTLIPIRNFDLDSLLTATGHN